ncbi:hypothetical protein HF086_014765 [Spodoptera exigua]|uniref:Uncharacterized protein n=1 Tax=Spodoptera exigua TaxID=7107 RepID=A0A922MIU2_SPOEX|nr:hypothetical protein HF086_014765 [Spodoptera exigua]
MEYKPTITIPGINNDPVSIATIRANWEKYVSGNTSLACFTEVDGQPKDLVGFNIVLVQGEAWKKLLRTLITAEESFDVFQHYQVDKYLTSSGLTVLPEHRGQNIGAKLFEASLHSNGLPSASSQMWLRGPGRTRLRRNEEIWHRPERMPNPIR